MKDRRKTGFGLMRMLVFCGVMMLVTVVCSCSAEAYDVPAGYASGTTYYVQDTITDWRQLESLISDYNTINLKGAYIHDGDISHLVHLGDSFGAYNSAYLPTITASSCKEQYPFRILPVYDANSGSFQMMHYVRTRTSPTVYKAFKWTGTLNYVYDPERNNSVSVVHGVTDENGTKMLQYATLTNVSSTDTAADTLVATGFDSPASGRTMTVAYNAVINGYGVYDSGALAAEFQLGVTYKYVLSADFLSVVSMRAEPEILGNIRVSAENEEGEPIAGAKFRLYTDAACTQEAERYSGTSWTSVGELEAGTDGSVSVSNVRAGTYYAVQTYAPGDYEAESGSKEIVLDEEDADLSLDTASGEGANAVINAENVTLNPIWDTDIKASTVGFIADQGGASGVSAASLGGDVFINGGGNPLAFASPEDVSRLEDLTALGGTEYEVSAGSISEDFATPTAALSYINSNLIASSGIDAAGARDSVEISISGAGLYADEGNLAETVFVNSVPAPDVPPTGLDGLESETKAGLIAIAVLTMLIGLVVIII